jgi:hypothetical protein
MRRCDHHCQPPSPSPATDCRRASVDVERRDSPQPSVPRTGALEVVATHPARTHARADDDWARRHGGGVRLLCRCTDAQAAGVCLITCAGCRSSAARLARATAARRRTPRRATACRPALPSRATPRPAARTPPPACRRPAPHNSAPRSPTTTTTTTMLTPMPTAAAPQLAPAEGVGGPSPPARCAAGGCRNRPRPPSHRRDRGRFASRPACSGSRPLAARWPSAESLPAAAGCGRAAPRQAAPQPDAATRRQP